FVLGYALADLLKAWGVELEAVTGHGVGEYAAACVAGGFSLEDGFQLVAERGGTRNGSTSGLLTGKARGIGPEAGSRVALASPRVALISGLTGKAVAEEVVTTDYWRRQADGPARVADALAELRREGCEILIELGPEPRLLDLERPAAPEGAAPPAGGTAQGP